MHPGNKMGPSSEDSKKNDFTKRALALEKEARFKPSLLHLLSLTMSPLCVKQGNYTPPPRIVIRIKYNNKCQESGT